ncbi:unnamed protein product [Closterium sp. Naga37s-1]|nr:unnamed protein product [Closterium sp. Naga37s-1]
MDFTDIGTCIPQVDPAHRVTAARLMGNTCPTCDRPVAMSHPWHHPPLFDRKNPSALRDFGRCRFVCTAAAVPIFAPSAQLPARSSSAESATASISSSTASASDLIAERERRTRVRHLVGAEPALTALTEPLPAGCPARGFLPQTAVLGGSSRSEELNMDLLSSAPLEALEIGPQAYRRRVGDVYDVIPVLAIPVKAPRQQRQPPIPSPYSPCAVSPCAVSPHPRTYPNSSPPSPFSPS